MDLRQLPSVDTLSRSDALSGFPPSVRVEAARAAIAQARAGDVDQGAIEAAAVAQAQKQVSSSLRRVINASGVILHTGLGRARLSPSAASAITQAAENHANVELDLEDNRRGDRQAHVRDLICELAGAEDALVVNNCAAAVFLTLAATCTGREVLLSRGQMVEIGGAFRMPDVVRQSCCTLVEVGCTNKTRLSDYKSALTDNTAAVLRCHPSNFKIVGFAEEPSLDALAAFCKENELLLIDDVGSGCLVDLAQFGLPPEPMLKDSLASGADVAMASGDKLLGGPQAGIIVGKKTLIEKIGRHPMARAVRIDKLTLAGLEATLRLYVTGQQSEIPTLRYLGRSMDELKPLAERLARAFQGKADVAEGLTEIGGGSVPGTGVPTWRVGLHSESPDKLAAHLRNTNPAVLGRIEDDLVWLDPRTMEDSEVAEVEFVLKTVPASGE